MLRKRIQLAFYVTAFAAWPATTYATSITLSKTLGEVPVFAWVIVFVLSTVSGIVSLLQRIKTDMQTADAEAALRRSWRWYTAAHLLGALFIGLLAFLVAEGAGLGDFFEAVFIAAMAWGGARAMDKMADGVTDGIVNRIVSVIGGSPPARKE